MGTNQEAPVKRSNNFAPKALVAAAMLVFVAAGLLIGFLTQRDSGSGRAIDGAAGDIRYIEAVQRTFYADGALQSTGRTHAWLSPDNSQMRLETSDSAGAVVQTVVIRDNTRLALREGSGSVIYSEVRVLPPYDVSERPQFLAAAEGLAAGDVQEVTREVNEGRTLVTVRAEGLGDSGSDSETEGPPITAYEAVFDLEAGLTLEERFYTTAPGGADELYATIRYEYPVDTFAADETVFSLEPPAGAWIYRDIELTPGELASFPSFTLYHPGAEFRGSALTEAQESQQENTPIPGTHLVNLVYEGAGLTVTNQPAARLAGMPRCDAPRAVVPGSAGDVVLEGNRTCGYGEEIMTGLGPAVLRSDSPTVEIQLGQTVVLVHARDAEAALEAVDLLTAIN